jgi:pimeloyl-ACP methyl ester carboxylesterase
MTDIVEQMHQAIWQSIDAAGLHLPEAVPTITAAVYGAIRGATRLVGGGADALLGLLPPDPDPDGSSVEREAVVAALNGVLGEHLAASGNPLAIASRFRREGHTLPLEPDALRGAIPRATGRVLVLLHGLCMNDRQWRRNGHDHGDALAAEAGFTPVYYHYNSGLHISENGREFAGRLEDLLRAWPVPVEELAILGHSMGGLVARSACHYGTAGGLGWPGRLGSLVFLGTPHHGAPLERGGSWVDAALEASPYTAAMARLGKVRSAGITDLRHGSLLDEDWKGPGRASGCRPLPLPEGPRCFAIGASLTGVSGHVGKQLLGDGLVPLDSALGRHEQAERDLGIADADCWIGHGMGHLDLLDHPEVYARIRSWIS